MRIRNITLSSAVLLFLLSSLSLAAQETHVGNLSGNAYARKSPLPALLHFLPRQIR